ncbi:dihydrofolate reductase [Nonomuraea deserti]|uniref:Dihydrofolate reductase n=1 Tax=Nonomuraea deserti TaxID=1848322 RepID=A0A4R4VWG1_9ACTN|nr:dihydrofolate reductase family protein [Nonomuraea deserti]TDD07154.1 dihydrofolate reductase [Nonomuraea deserti]
MNNTEPPPATGIVLWGFTMTLNGFVAGPRHEMDWMTGFSARPGVIDELIESTGAVLAGRDGFDSAIGDSRPWGGAWEGPIFVLTHHPEDAPPTPDITFLSCPVQEAVQIGLEAAAGKNLAVFSPNIGTQLLELGLIDEIDIHIAPVLLGEGIRLYHNPGRTPVRLHRLDSDDPTLAARVRYRPTTTANIPGPAG